MSNKILEIFAKVINKLSPEIIFNKGYLCLGIYAGQNNTTIIWCYKTIIINIITN